MHLWKYNFEIHCVQFLLPLIGQKNWMKTTEKSLDRTPLLLLVGCTYHNNKVGTFTEQTKKTLSISV